MLSSPPLFLHLEAQQEIHTDAAPRAGKHLCLLFNPTLHSVAATTQKVKRFETPGRFKSDLLSRDLDILGKIVPRFATVDHARSDL